MIRLTKALNAWNTPGFNDILKQEFEQLDGKLLPLQQGLSQGSHANGDNLGVLIISSSEESGFIRAKLGIFYTSIIAGCSCADDPTPIDEHTEYCELRIDIDKSTALTKVTLLGD